MNTRDTHNFAEFSADLRLILYPNFNPSLQSFYDKNANLLVYFSNQQKSTTTPKILPPLMRYKIINNY